MTIKELAKRARAATGLSQRAFAELLKVSPVSVSRWETGYSMRPATKALLLMVMHDPAGALKLFRNELSEIRANLPK